MSGWRATLGVLLVFVAGLVTGGAAMHVYRMRVERSVLNSPEPGIQIVVLALDRDLALSDAQKAEVRQILLDSRNHILTAHPELMPELMDTFEQTQGRISEILTPEQRVKYERLVEERRRAFDEVKRNTASGT